LQEKVKIIS